MKQIEKKIDDIYGPLLFAYTNLKLSKQYDEFNKSSYRRFNTYCKIMLFKNTVINIGVLFDRSHSTSSFYKFNEMIKSGKLHLKANENWITLYETTFKKAKQIIDLRHKFHAHKNSAFEINNFWDKYPDEYGKIPQIISNCKTLFDILSLETLGYKLDFEAFSQELLRQMKTLYK
ncbi:MAG: hypothetical protein HQ534_07080 [Armatimonadetes bacterium]|nr:hypothetical protein [Armatimonadota bacterium]